MPRQILVAIAVIVIRLLGFKKVVVRSVKYHTCTHVPQLDSTNDLYFVDMETDNRISYSVVREKNLPTAGQIVYYHPRLDRIIRSFA